MSFISNYYALSAKAKLSLLDYVKENVGVDLKAYEIDRNTDSVQISSNDSTVNLKISFSENGDVTINKTYGKVFDAEGPSAKVNLPGIETSDNLSNSGANTSITDFGASVSAGSITTAKGGGSYTVIDDDSGSMFEFKAKVGAMNASAAASCGFDILKDEDAYKNVDGPCAMKIDAKFAELGIKGTYTSPLQVSYDVESGSYKASQFEIGAEFGAGAGLEGNVLSEGKIFKMKAVAGLGGGLSVGYDGEYDDLMLSDSDKRELMIEALEKKVSSNSGIIDLAARSAPSFDNNVLETQNTELKEKLDILYEERYAHDSEEVNHIFEEYGLNNPFESEEPANYVELSSGGTDAFEMVDQLNQLEQYISILNSKIELLNDAILKI